MGDVDEIFYTNPFLFDANANVYHDPLRQASFGDRRDFYVNVAQIRRALGGALNQSTTLIEFHCYNEYEKNETAKLLTEEERKHVRFFWLTFDEYEALT